MITSALAARYLPAGSIRDELDRTRGLGSGFDYMRLGLALLVFLFHCRWVLSGDAGANLVPHDAPEAVTVGAWQGWLRPFKIAAVPMFFILGGFLVAASAARLSSAWSFFMFRALRVIPALSVEVLLSALVLGPLLTAAPLAVYFADAKFYLYFLNIFGIVSYELPGLFETNPVSHIVNMNLWTIPWELIACFLTMALMAAGLLARRTVLLAATAIVSVAIVVAHVGFGFAEAKNSVPGFMLVHYFMLGVMFFLWRDRIPLRLPLALGAAVLAYGFLSLDATLYVAPVFVAYLTIYLGLLRLPRLPVLSYGDYSYSIYLYGFPISQALMALRPELASKPLLFIGAAGLGTMMFALFSWHAIERPALALKRRFASPSAARPALPEAARAEPSLERA